MSTATVAIIFLASFSVIVAICNQALTREYGRLKKENCQLTAEVSKFVQVFMESPKRSRIGELIDSLRFMGVTNSYTTRENKVISTVIEFGGLVEVKETNIDAGIFLENKVELLYRDTLIKGLNIAQEKELIKIAHNKLADKVMDEFSYGPRCELINSGSRKVLPQETIL